MNEPLAARMAVGAGSAPQAEPSTSGPDPDVLERFREFHFTPEEHSVLIDRHRYPRRALTEELHRLRTRLSHLQSGNSLHSLLITSPSPGEGKSSAAANLAIAQGEVADNPTLLCDFDLRHPVVHELFRIDRGPGVTDYLRGRAPLTEVIRRMAGSNLYVMPSGTAVENPQDVLCVPDLKASLEHLSALFRWVILDTPPLLFVADAGLLAAQVDATILVARIGTTTHDALTRARQSLCENNVLGIVINGIRTSELYSKYRNYYSEDS